MLSEHIGFELDTAAVLQHIGQISLYDGKRSATALDEFEHFQHGYDQ